jgi:hypothetical protein
MNSHVDVETTLTMQYIQMVYDIGGNGDKWIHAVLLKITALFIWKKKLV